MPKSTLAKACLVSSDVSCDIFVTDCIASMDLRAGIIEDVKVSADISALRRTLGFLNVESFSQLSGGKILRSYEIHFGAERKAQLKDDLLTIEDNRFRTEEGLGVGTTWSQFHSHYPDADWIHSPDSGSMWSERYKFHLYFKGGSQPREDDRTLRIAIDVSSSQSMLDGRASW